MCFVYLGGEKKITIVKPLQFPLKKKRQKRKKEKKATHSYEAHHVIEDGTYVQIVATYPR
jgi:tRNA(Leu) C34 or U34 (ribose-2'-O)-methylase TrmL